LCPPPKPGKDTFGRFRKPSIPTASPASQRHASTAVAAALRRSQRARLPSSATKTGRSGRARGGWIQVVLSRSIVAILNSDLLYLERSPLGAILARACAGFAGSLQEPTLRCHHLPCRDELIAFYV
jgi:hypothetical protein